MMFGENANLGPALALSYAIIPCAVMVFLALGLRPMRAAVADVAHESAAFQ